MYKTDHIPLKYIIFLYCPFQHVFEYFSIFMAVHVMKRPIQIDDFAQRT